MVSIYKINLQIQYAKIITQNVQSYLHICIQFLQSYLTIIIDSYIYKKSSQNQQMKSNQKNEDMFHLFVQYADKIPQEAQYFLYFQYMDQSIRKSFNQLKKNSIKKYKQLQAFQQFWQELTSEDRVKIYCNWVLQLRTAIQLQKNNTIKKQHESMSIQDQIYIKKNNLFQTWEKKIAKLTPTHLHLGTGSKIKQYELKDYQIRRSRAKDHFAWVLQAISNSAKTLHCKAQNQGMFDEWYYALSVNITNQRIQHFINSIKREKANPGIIKKLSVKKSSKTQNKEEKQKTLTQIMIDKQMKSIDNENITQIDQNGDEDQFQSIGDSEDQKQKDFDQQNKQSNMQKKKMKQQQEQQSNPNIFKRLVPQYKQSLLNFADTPFNSALIFNDSQCRIYELPQKGQGDQIILKMFTIFPYSKSLIFQAVATQTMGWNDEVDVFTVKTKISSQNTALIYEKNKAYGLLYRQRDYLYLRHCFSILNIPQKNSFIIDKSIDSIHHPPFMSVVRAEKKLIWGLIQKQNQKQCILIIQGWIKGGGYMNHVQNKQMTVKYMKKINSLRGFLKQLSFSNPIANNIFKQDWVVDFNKQDMVSSQKMVQIEVEQKLQIKEKQKKQEHIVMSKKSQKQEKLDNQLAQFMIRTSQQSKQNQAKSQHEIPMSEQRFQLQNYKPPQFDAKKLVIIPTAYLKKVHILTPKQKPTKPNLYPHIKGHHLFKGQWQISAAGGLGYIDQQKMKQQKKVLTYIIKRIGKNIFTGKGILNISLPVDIFCVQSNIQRLAMSFGFLPYYLQKAANIKQAHEQLKYVVGGAIAGSLIYMTIQKPFNPILGQTYQCWMDGCPIYFQQISHHPPIAAFIMKGRGYTLSGCVEAKMDLSINSGTGLNEGVFKIQFDNGNTFYYTTPVGCLSGLTYGQRKLNLIGKCYYWTQTGLFLQTQYNPYAKTKGFFGGGGKGQGDQKLPDYFQGYIKQYTPQQVRAVAFKQTQTGYKPIIPKASPTGQAIKTHLKLYGRWTKYLKCNDQQIFDCDTTRYYAITDEKYPLPSHSNYRQDIVYRRIRNFVLSQQFKQFLEVKQREDRKFRAKFNKNSH